MADGEQVAAAVAQVADRGRAIEVLVNNAGVGPAGDAAELTETEWDGFFAVDLKGAWLCAKHALPHIRALGAGAIVNISSIHAYLTRARMFPYAAAKSGLLGLTRSLALDLAPEQIRVTRSAQDSSAHPRSNGSTTAAPTRTPRGRGSTTSTRSAGSARPKRSRRSPRSSPPRPQPA
jgi:NAD(P)-dependent dehydrogenase (short-subunit alcohol dehydrogenase family)